ncbi:MAG: hypothetical protein HA493_04960 [Candidatus Verstraetearchaeota archaeon]|nr:hypothetical protein [Candidatus Verstraetearchaeota archaeon]
MEKERKCSIKNCEDNAIRSISPLYSKILIKAGFSLNESDRLYLCKEHYKELKKLKRKEDRLERWRLKG